MLGVIVLIKACRPEVILFGAAMDLQQSTTTTNPPKPVQKRVIIHIYYCINIYNIYVGLYIEHINNFAKERSKQFYENPFRGRSRRSKKLEIIISPTYFVTSLVIWLILPLVRNTCNNFDVIKNLHRGIPKPERTTQAPLVYINAHSCIYNKCLIVISRRDTIERRGSQKKVRFGVPV